MTPSAELLAVLDRAYEAFSAYPRPRVMEASPLRNPTEILSTLSSASLRDLTGEQIGPYSGWALTTVGCVDDYKHFLPRILEQAVRASLWLGTQPQVVASKLEMAAWRDWPRSEQEAVASVFSCALRVCIQGHPEDGCDASEWLCAVGSLGEDMESVLREWETEAQGNALLQIAMLATELPAITSMNRDEQMFWADVERNARAQVADWLTSNPIAVALANGGGIRESDRWQVEQAIHTLREYWSAARN